MGDHAAEELFTGTLRHLMMLLVGKYQGFPRTKTKQMISSYLFNDNVVENNVTVVVIDHVIVRGGKIVHNHGLPG